MDPLNQLQLPKDSTLALIEEAQRRGWSVHVCQAHELWTRNDQVLATCYSIDIQGPCDALQVNWAHETPIEKALSDFDMVWMRKDPPVDQLYFHALQLLNLAQNKGTLVVNRPLGVLACNEKMGILPFKAFIPKTLVTSQKEKLQAFYAEVNHIVIKDLNSMGGDKVLSFKAGQKGFDEAIESFTHEFTQPIMAQEYLRHADKGDKRIFIINGKAYPYGLLRVPKQGDFRGNLAQGAQGIGKPLTSREQNICDSIGPYLKSLGLWFVGVDVVGGFLTEINVTSPTCIREIDRAFDVQVSAVVLNELQSLL